MFGNRISLTVLRTIGGRTCNRSGPDLWTCASSAVVTAYISGKNQAQTESCENVKQTLRNQKDYHWEVFNTGWILYYVFKIYICRRSWALNLDLLLVYAAIQCICGGSVFVFACVLVHDCGWNGWNVYAATGCTRFPLTVSETAQKHSIPPLFLMRLPPLWVAKQGPQIYREEKKSSSFIETDHTTHPTIHPDWQFFLLQFMVI